ncbi:MAG: hypothetical protein QM658_12845 [Gordonia sp. (in: high G+C Gram-positive bacteria)]
MRTSTLTRFGAAVAGAALVGAGAFAAGPAEATTPPTISVAPAGATEWTFTWDGEPAAACDFVLDGVPMGSVVAKGNSTGGMYSGAHRVAVSCGGQKSNSVWVYSPRSPMNDIKTQFSNATQGAFGS